MLLRFFIKKWTSRHVKMLFFDWFYKGCLKNTPFESNRKNDKKTTNFWSIFDHFWDPIWWKIKDKIGSVFLMKFWSIFDRFWRRLGSLLGAIWRSKTHQKKSKKKNVNFKANFGASWSLPGGTNAIGTPAKHPVGRPRRPPNLYTSIQENKKTSILGRCKTEDLTRLWS